MQLMNYEYLLLLSNFMAFPNFLKQVSHLDIYANNELPLRWVKIHSETLKRESATSVQSRVWYVSLLRTFTSVNQPAEQKLFA